MKKGVVKLGWILSLILASANISNCFAADAIPVCPAYGRPLPINNEQILHWKRTTPNQFRERGHIKGLLVRIYNDKSGHDHFSIQIGKDKADSIEVIYNQDFGALPGQLTIGSTVEACGDFIVSTAPSGPYPASPDGAIIHWIHMNPSGKGHDPGFLVIDGTLYGQDAENAGPGGKYGKDWRDKNRPGKNNGNAGKNNWQRLNAEINQLSF